MEYIRRIRLFGEDYVLVGTLEGGGAIATGQEYSDFDTSYAFLNEDGSIMRFGEQIGSREDIELMPIEVKLEPTKAGWAKAFSYMKFIIGGR